MTAAATAIAHWVEQAPWIDGVLFGSSDGEVQGPPMCAVAVAGSLRGFGKGHTQSQALASAIGELLEQVAGKRLDARRILRASYRQLGSRAFDPRWLGLYRSEQYTRLGFPFRPFDANEDISWIEGRWLDTQEPVFLPAFAVYLADVLIAESWCQVTSSGLAAAASLEAAIEHAVLELYERDAFLLSWRALTRKRKVQFSDQGGIAAHLATRGASVDCYAIREECVYVVAAIASGDGHVWPAFTLGLGAARSLHAACDKALLELGQTAPYFARAWRRAEIPLPQNAAGVKTLPDQAMYYCDAAHRPEFNHWLTSTGGAPLANDTDVRLAVVDLTPQDLCPMPYHVVRVLAQGLQSLDFGYGYDRLPCPRLTRLLGGRPANAAPCPLC